MTNSLVETSREGYLTLNVSDENVSDIDLGARLAARDGTALYIVFDRYLERLTVFIYKELCEKYSVGFLEDAEDIAAKTLFDVWETYDPKRGSSLKTWLYRLARQNIYGFLRRELVREKESQEQLEPQSELLERDVLLQETIMRLFESLPPERQQLLTWKVLDGKTFREIAEDTGEIEETVKSRYYRILKELKAELEIREFLYLTKSG